MSQEVQIHSKLVTSLANIAGIEEAAYLQAVKSTAMPKDHTPAQLAAFLMVARQYELNPLLKEIYAFPAKGGGIVPIVSIDGWSNIINSHPQFDGMDFEEIHDDKGALISTTCVIYRKDRTHPTRVTEYLSECVRNTDPWKMKHRMLRHKSMIQCSRYAFSLSGIYDEDEGQKIAEIKERESRPTPPTPTVASPTVSEDAEEIEFNEVSEEASPTEETIEENTDATEPQTTPDQLVDRLIISISCVSTVEDVMAIADELDIWSVTSHDEVLSEKVTAIIEERCNKLRKATKGKPADAQASPPAPPTTGRFL